MQDSNLRLLAPEANGNINISIAYSDKTLHVQCTKNIPTWRQTLTTQPAPQNLATAPLAVLRQLAKEAPDAANRRAAQAEIERRITATDRAVPTVAGTIEDVDGGKIPTLTLRYGTRAPREMRAALYTLAAEVERKLALTTEAWTVRLQPELSDQHCALEILLMEETEPEQQRALALLRSLSVPSAPRKRGRKPGQSKRKPADKSEAAASQPATKPIDKPGDKIEKSNGKRAEAAG